jgi:hypothetical protein
LDLQKLEAAQMRFLRPLLGLTRLDRLRNRDIRIKLKVGNIVEDIKLSKEMVSLPGKNGQKPPTEAGFPVPTSGMVEYGKTETKNTLSFKGAGLKT